MKVAVIAGRGRVEIVERELPAPRPGWVRLAIGAVGICGSDLNLLQGSLLDPTGMQPGHEVAGYIDALGEGVALASGSAVALEPLHGCGDCFHCNTGHHNLCENGRLFGVSAKGGMAEFMTVPAACLHMLPKNVDMQVAALAEPMAVAVRGVRLGRIGIGSRVTVLGAGTIGLLSVVAARAAGAEEILITARYPQQAELARSLGATAVYTDIEALAKAGGYGADVVIETVGGTADTLTEATAAVRRGGTIVMLGVFEGSPRIPGLPFFYGELTLVASNCYAHDAPIGDFALATRLVLRHASELTRLVTHRFSLDGVARAYATAADKKEGAIKVHIRP
ncbi:MAG: alcohol dehydrogenase catalytic domain-containing protein [Gammaproteobacteria bacterium]|nr:alcohol dehydrogenase catalytic domain-containing protein [Gammaproteobacteria bacterium]